jgi:hypothetical protein
VLDASSSGALTETTERLLPGRRLDVHVMTQAGRVLVRGRVVRAHVCQLQPDAIHYRAALAFDQPIDAKASGYERPSVLASPSAQDTTYSDRSSQSDIVYDERVTA